MRRRAWRPGDDDAGRHNHGYARRSGKVNEGWIGKSCEVGIVSEPGAVATGSYTQLDFAIRSLPLRVLTLATSCCELSLNELVMKKIEVLQTIRDVGVIPVVRASSAEEAIHVVEAIKAGGLPILEITMTVPGAVKVIEQLVKRFGE